MPCSAVRDGFEVGDGMFEGGGSYFVDGSLSALEGLPGVFARGVLFTGRGVVDGEGEFLGEGLGEGLGGGSPGENCVEAARTRSLRAGDFDICGALIKRITN